MTEMAAGVSETGAPLGCSWWLQVVSVKGVLFWLVANGVGGITDGHRW